MKGNVINLNTLHLNSVRLNGIGKVQSVSLKGGSTEDPVFPPIEPPVEPEPAPAYTLSASVANGVVSATLNGVVVSLPYTANEGDVIVVSVTPNDGYEFNGWNDGNTDNPRTITMNADVALSAQCVEVVQPPVGKYIQFEDKAVEAICVENWSSDGIGLTEEDAAKVTSLGAVFKGNTSIISFDELQYFTGLTPYLKPPTTWNDGAFYNCTSLERVTLPPNVTILSSDFRSCKNLREVRGLEQITDITSEAFNSCSALAMELNLERLKTIVNASFTNSGIVAILSLGKVKNIPGSSTWNYTPFANCKSLKTVVLPSTLESIGDNAFNNCQKMEWMKVLATTPPSMATTNTLLSTNNCPIYVPDASLEAYKTATNWNQFADRIHPLSEIEGSPYIQFEDAEVERILMANGVSSDGIGITKEDAAAVTNLKQVFNKASIETFGEFVNFTGIASMGGNYTNFAMSSLREIDLPSSVKAFNKDSYGGQTGAFRNCKSLISIGDTSHIETLGRYSFENCSAYTQDVDMPSLKDTIGYMAMYASGIKKIVNLGNATILEGVPHASVNSPQGAFAMCKSLEEARIPATMEQIQKGSFGFCTALKTIICEATTPPALDANAWYGSNALANIYVPDASLEAYKGATNWEAHASLIKGISEYNG